MLFVYNPKSGTGQIRFSLSKIIERFSAADYDITVYPTKAPEDAVQIVRARAAGYDIIVCSGGDGTLDEVVTGMIESGVSLPIGYIPSGSTNDFAGSIGIPKQAERAADTVVDGEPFQCDIGRFNGNDYFVYVAAFGLLTDVSYQTKQELKNVLGHAAYIIEGVKRLGSWRSYSLEIESDAFSGRGDFIYGMASNANSIGGFKGLPGKDIELDDGLFEVMLVRTPMNLQDWQRTINALLMNEKSNDNVIRFKTHRLVIRSDEPLAWTRDGEDGGEHTCVELENMPRVLTIMAGGQAAAAGTNSAGDQAAGAETDVSDAAGMELTESTDPAESAHADEKDSGTDSPEVAVTSEVPEQDPSEISEKVPEQAPSEISEKAPEQETSEKTAETAAAPARSRSELLMALMATTTMQELLKVLTEITDGIINS
ncbi:MAG: YegS/Rv2252/BmrU family lipid kinase [Lachnospiraceae bacterium]|nr:YegS/Rv2252/BmrU family lipid kinase [Lachnospiraceae bacterium]